MGSTTFHIPSSAETYIAAMEGMTRLDEIIVEDGLVPPLYETGAVYKQKGDGAIWRHAIDVAEQKWGNCIDFATYRAAELRVSGEDPGAYAWSYKTGPHKWHAVVWRTQGKIPDFARSKHFPDAPIEDPSIALGMGMYGHGSAGNAIEYNEAEAADAQRKILSAQRKRNGGNIMGMCDRPMAVVGDDPTPEYQQISFDVARVDDKWVGVVRIPVGQGKALMMSSSGSKNPANTARKTANLTKAALSHPAIKAAMPPQAQAAAQLLNAAPTKKIASGLMKAHKLFH